MKLLIIIQFFLISTTSIFSIDIYLHNEFGGPKYSNYGEELSEKYGIKNTGNVVLSWIGKNEIIYSGPPLFWLVDIQNGKFNRFTTLEEIIDNDTVTMGTNYYSDNIMISSGWNFDRRFGIYSLEYGWKELESVEDFKKLNSRPYIQKDLNIRGDHTDWAFELLGNHLIVSGPVFGGDGTLFYEGYEYGISLLRSDSKELSPLDNSGFNYRNIGNSSMTAVSFDRFRLAIFSDVVLIEETRLEKWGLFVFRINYDGIVPFDISIREEPSQSSSLIGELSEGSKVTVTDADNYEIDENQREDFWYFVKSDNVSGWMYGGDLIIEDQTWEERLQVRGKPLDWDSIEEYDRTNEVIIGHVFDGDFQVELKVDADKNADIIRIVKPDEQFVLLGQSEKFQLINNNYNRWYHVRLDNGIEGWIFGYYISFKKLVEKNETEETLEIDEKIEEEEQENVESIKDKVETKKDISFAASLSTVSLKVIIIVLVCILFIILGIVFLVKKRQKN